MSLDIRMTGGRLSYPKLFKADSFKADQTKKFGCTVLLVPGTVIEKKVGDKWVKTTIEAVFAEVADAEWKGKSKQVLATLDDKTCALRDGNKKLDKDGEIQEAYAGIKYIVMKNTARPRVVDASGKNEVREDDGIIYGGCYVRVLGDVYATSKDNKGIHAHVHGVQFLKDGDSFTGSGRVSKEDDFEDLSVDEESMV